uniref:Uncharacterized protein n=1 Tax=Meloidogyne enterolobii TaxID=390850 RepID=A0A6V7WZR7_MELEN|nr:unnamed protein product [Meloidogyne enterolobii]
MSSKTVDFILKKLSKLRLEMTVEDFAEFLYNWGIMQLPENVTFDELKQDNHLQAFVNNDERIKYWLLHLKTNREMFDLLYNYCKDNINIDKKVYIYWHLFLFVRMLIRNFVQFHNNNNYYNVELDKRANDTGELYIFNKNYFIGL